MTFKPAKITLIPDEDGHPSFQSETGERARILKDSISESGHRLTTMELTFYRGVLAEFNTHRVFSRNSASSRAIPTMKMIKQVLDNPYVPSYWGAYQSGMQAHTEMNDVEEAKKNWIDGSVSAVNTAMTLLFGGDWKNAVDKFGVGGAFTLFDLGKVSPNQNSPHKQIVNRVLEPYLWHTVIVSSTEYSNFFNLRADEDADPAIQQLAYTMKKAYESSLPEPVEVGEWHMPLIREEDISEHRSTNSLKKISSARCARVSYLTHDGKRDHRADLELYRKLVTGKPHASPLEHVATPARDGDYILGNFSGWHQYRAEVFG